MYFTCGAGAGPIGGSEPALATATGSESAAAATTRPAARRERGVCMGGKTRARAARLVIRGTDPLKRDCPRLGCAAAGGPGAGAWGGGEELAGAVAEHQRAIGLERRE